MKKLIVLLGFILTVNISYANEGFYMYCTQDSNQQIKCEPVQNVVNTNQNNVQQPYRTQSSIQTTAQNTSGSINDISNAIYSLRSMIDTIKNF